MAAGRRSSGVGRFKRQGSPLLYIQQQQQRQPQHLSLACAPAKRLLIIIAIILTTGIISHPFILFHLYNNHNVQHYQPRLSSSSSSSSSARQQQPTQIRNNNNPQHVFPRLGRQSNDNNDNDLLRPGCLTEACINATAATFLARAYPNRTDQGWCLTEKTTTTSSANNVSNNSNNQKGILLIKVPKGASSTAAGVAIRIARRRHCQQGLQWRHKTASSTLPSYANRSRQNSFLFTTIRDPASRAVSTIFFHVVSRMTQNNNKFNNNTNATSASASTSSSSVTVSDEFLLQYLQEHKHPHHGAISQPGQGGFQLRYTSMEEIPVDPSPWRSNNATTRTAAGDVVVVHHPEMIVQRVQATMNAYDFILVTERMEESLVAMSLLMGISVGDVLVTASKVAGSRYHLAHLPGNVFKCIQTVKSVISPTVQAYLESDAWRAANYGDYLLHQAASLSLDRTISQIIGHDAFQTALLEYRQLRVLEQTKCAPHVHFPCSNDGDPQPELSKKSCYLPFFDFGCGHACIDDIIKQQQQQTNSSGGVVVAPQQGPAQRNYNVD